MIRIEVLVAARPGNIIQPGFYGSDKFPASTCLGGVVSMNITYLAHSCFLITASDGTKVLIDPYESGSYDGAVKYGPVREIADLVLVTHDTHPDHITAESLPGSPVVIKSTGPSEEKGIRINGVATYHDPNEGRDRGANTVFIMEIDGIKVCHLGDLGHILTVDQLDKIGKPDVVMIPVGGYFTIDSSEANKVVNQLSPKIVMPIHYKTAKLDFPIAGRDEFLRGKENVKMVGGSEIQINPEDLTGEQQIFVLDHKL